MLTGCQLVSSLTGTMSVPRRTFTMSMSQTYGPTPLGQLLNKMQNTPGGREVGRDTRPMRRSIYTSGGVPRDWLGTAEEWRLARKRDSAAEHHWANRGAWARPSPCALCGPIDHGGTDFTAAPGPVERFLAGFLAFAVAVADHARERAKYIARGRVMAQFIGKLVAQREALAMSKRRNMRVPRALARKRELGELVAAPRESPIWAPIPGAFGKVLRAIANGETSTPAVIPTPASHAAAWARSREVQEKALGARLARKLASPPPVITIALPPPRVIFALPLAEAAAIARGLPSLVERLLAAHAADARGELVAAGNAVLVLVAPAQGHLAAMTKAQTAEREAMDAWNKASAVANRNAPQFESAFSRYMQTYKLQVEASKTNQSLIHPGSKPTRDGFYTMVYQKSHARSVAHKEAKDAATRAIKAFEDWAVDVNLAGVVQAAEVALVPPVPVPSPEVLRARWAPAKRKAAPVIPASVRWAQEEAAREHQAQERERRTAERERQDALRAEVQRATDAHREAMMAALEAVLA